MVDLEVALSHDGASRADFVEVADPGDLAPGDDVAVGWVITDAFVDEHGMTGTWKAFNGTWQPFFLRTVVAVDTSTSPARIKLDVPLRYPAKLRDAASVRRQRGAIRECGVESLAISNAVGWDDAWTVMRSHAIRLAHTKDCWIRGVSSFASPFAPSSGPGAGGHLQSGGLLIEESKRVTVADTRLGLAQNRGDGGNGYLFEIQRSSEVLFRDDVGENGRHNFIQNWGFGTTGCVFLRVESRGGVSMISKTDTLGLTGLSEFHHSLATANLIDSSTFDDGFSIVNRNDESTGAGLAGTENVLWNLRGQGTLRSLQYRTGYVIGTRDLFTVTESPLPMGAGRPRSISSRGSIAARASRRRRSTKISSRGASRNEPGRALRGCTAILAWRSRVRSSSHGSSCRSGAAPLHCAERSTRRARRLRGRDRARQRDPRLSQRMPERVSRPVEMADSPRSSRTSISVITSVDPRLVDVDPLLATGSWRQILELLGPPEAIERLPPTLGLIYAVALRESVGDASATPANELAIRSMAAIYGSRPGARRPWCWRSGCCGRTPRRGGRSPRRRRSLGADHRDRAGARRGRGLVDEHGVAPPVLKAEARSAPSGTCRP